MLLTGQVQLQYLALTIAEGRIAMASAFCEVTSEGKRADTLNASY
jgi:hypothetical protein